MNAQIKGTRRLTHERLWVAVFERYIFILRLPL